MAGGSLPRRDGHSSGTRIAARLEQPTRTTRHRNLPLPACAGSIVPIRFCSRWGLPCRPRCRVRGALLPHLFTLTLRERGAVRSLWHFPWGRPRRTLSGTVSPWSPDFPRRLRAAAARPTDAVQMKAAVFCVKDRRSPCLRERKRKRADRSPPSLYTTLRY